MYQRVSGFKKTDTGFPGRQITGLLFTTPKARGLPGFIAIFQKIIFRIFFNTFTIWSSSPTDAPPVVIIASNLLAAFKIEFSIFWNYLLNYLNCYFSYPYLVLENLKKNDLNYLFETQLIF